MARLVRLVMTVVSVASLDTAASVARGQAAARSSGVAPAAWKGEDTQRFTRVGEAQVSPDGQWVAFQAARRDTTNTGAERAIWIVSTRGGTPKVLTPAGAADETPRWSPDGSRLGFLTYRNGATELWTMRRDGTDRRRVCAIRDSNHRLAEGEEGESFAWSPDGSTFAVISVDAAAQPVARDPLVVTRLGFWAYDDYDDGLRAQLWVVPAAGGTPRRLSDGEHVDIEPAWSPDGREIVFVSNHEPDPDLHRKDDLWVVNVATGQTRHVATGEGSAVRPAWSPDGKWIAFLGTHRKWATYDSMAEDFHAWVVAATGGDPRDLGAALDRRTESVAWMPDSRAVIVSAQDRGRMLPYRVPLDAGPAVPLFDANVSAGEPSISRDGHLAFTVSSITRPEEVAALDPGSDAPRMLTTLNAAASSALGVRDADTIWVRSSENTMVESWLMLPAQGSAARVVPMVLLVHGGPHGAFGYRFDAQQQLFASRGYAVLTVNPRGSTGYGHAFADACIGNWGGVDYVDLMSTVDAVLRTHPEIDPNRLVVTGGSYGGYMTNWIVTHTARFRAAVTREGMSNLMTDQALSDASDLEVLEFGTPWDHEEDYLRASPIRYIAHAVTPTLIIQGERDHDVTFAEAGQMYVALRWRGVETQLVLYPREPHGFREPRHIADAYERTLQWFDSHIASERTVDQHWDTDWGAEQWEGEGLPRMNGKQTTP